MLDLLFVHDAEPLLFVHDEQAEVAGATSFDNSRCVPTMMSTLPAARLRERRRLLGFQS